MAVVVTQNPSGLKMRFNAGLDPETQKQITKSRTYSAITPSANNQDIFDVANVLASLQEYPLIEIQRIDNSTLSA